MQYLSLSTLPEYEVYVSRRALTAVERDGLIEPILVNGSHVHEAHRERYMAFRRLAEKYGTVHTVIAVDWKDLSPAERREFGWKFGRDKA